MHARESSLSRALSSARASYHAAKAAVAERGDQLFAAPGVGGIGQKTDFSKAAEQERHFTGWVYAAVKAVGQRCAAQPLRVELASNPGVAIENHPIVALFGDPNPIQTRGALIFSIVAALELTGRALLWTTEGKDGPQLWHIPSSWIVDAMATGAGFQGFTIRPPGHAGEPIPIPADEATYIYYPAPHDPRACQSPLQACAFAVEADDSIQVAQYAAFQQGIYGSHAIILGRNTDAEGKPTLARPSLTGDQQRQLIEAVRRRWLGVGRREPLILDSMIEDVKQISASIAEMDFLESSKLTKQRILQTFGVNEIVLGAIEGANRASAVVAEQIFCSTKVQPLLALIGEALTEWLAPQFGEGLVVTFEKATARDEEMRLAIIDRLMRAGAITLDELRTEFGFEPLNGLAGASMVGEGGLKSLSNPERALVNALTSFIGGTIAHKEWSTEALFGEHVGKILCGNRE